MKYNIISKNAELIDIKEIEAPNEGEAMISFAANMDTDMNNYFKAVPSENAKRAIVKDIVRLIKSMDLDNYECNDIFDALKEQNNVLGGRIFTTDDILKAAGDCEYPEDINFTEPALEIIAHEIKNNSEGTLNIADDYDRNAIKNGIQESAILIPVTNIEWDIDLDFDTESEYEEFLIQNGLFNQKKIPIGKLVGFENIGDYLSELTGYCIKSYKVEKPIEGMTLEKVKGKLISKINELFVDCQNEMGIEYRNIDLDLSETLNKREDDLVTHIYKVLQWQKDE